jgi:hypothetical protein
MVEEKIDFSTLQDLPEVERESAIYETSFVVNFELSVKLREYLKGFEGSNKYDEERAWVDRIFKRIDERLSQSEDLNSEQIKSFKIAILMEMGRRQAAELRKSKQKGVAQ